MSNAVAATFLPLATENDRSTPYRSGPLPWRHAPTARAGTDPPNPESVNVPCNETLRPSGPCSGTMGARVKSVIARRNGVIGVETGAGWVARTGGTAGAG